MRTSKNEEIKNKAIELRKQGISQSKIAKMLGYSDGTVWRWVKDIELSEEQKLVLKKSKGNHVLPLHRKLGAYKIDEYNEARRLRIEEGLSLNDISKKLNVAKSSVSLWVRDIRLTDEQKNRLICDNGKLGNEERKSTYYKRRLQYQNNGKDMVGFGNNEYIAGIMLYWAEGSKSRTAVQLTNSDMYMIKFFVKFLRNNYYLNDEDILIRINCYDDIHSLEEIEKYWLENIGLPNSSLRKTMLNKKPISSKQTKRGKCEYGVCNVLVYRVDIVQSIYGAIQEFIGFENKKWID